MVRIRKRQALEEWENFDQSDFTKQLGWPASLMRLLVRSLIQEYTLKSRRSCLSTVSGREEPHVRTT